MKKPIGLLLILFGLVDFPAPTPGSRTANVPRARGK